MKNILVLRGGALGDFIVTLPALLLLRERWPEARIELAGNATAAQLALARGWLDAAHSQHEARWSGLFGDSTLDSAFADWLAGFDLIVNYWPDPEGELRRRFPRRADQVFLCGSAMPTRAPAAAHYCEPLHELGLEPRTFFVPLKPLVREKSRQSSARDTILIHPGSGSANKNWPMENWRELIAILPKPVALILGPAELEPSKPVAEAVTLSRESLTASATQTIMNPSLEALVDLLSGCRLFLGHDSGISHLAAACGAKCVLLFGPTEPAWWAPPAPNVRVLRRGHALAAVAVDEVRSVAEVALADQT